jgi:hypothetical protein
MTDPRTASPDNPRKKGGVPPLVWIVLVLLVGWFAVMMMQRKGADESPQGGTHPVQAEGPSVMPAAPANGSAPATPAGVANGPNQPEPPRP